MGETWLQRVASVFSSRVCQGFSETGEIKGVSVLSELKF